VAPEGTPKRKPLTTAERQARWRRRRSNWVAALEETVAKHGLSVPLRNDKPGSNLRSLRNDPLRHDKDGTDRPALPNAETTDDALTQLRRRGDRLMADYCALVSQLTPAEVETLIHRIGEWRTQIKAAAAKRVIPIKRKA